MNDYIELKQFILDRIYKKKFNLNNLSSSLRIREDLGFDGDDAAILIYDYSHKFGVDVNDLNIKNYIYPEDYLYFWISFLLPFLKEEKKEITIGDLIKGISLGRLSDNIIDEKYKKDTNFV